MASITKFVLLFIILSISLLGFGQKKFVPGNKADTLPIKFDSLKAAVVTATLRPRMRGDTLEYNVAHVQMPPNSMIEELLRRLPGLRVDADGNITYNGEKIQHLLVDGEDVFGDDPTMVTRNFDASKIARIQILDRKSEKAIFTGMDDGTRTKTLNLVLKGEAKNGYFGRIEASGGPNGHYTAAGAIAGFQNREQLTALALSGNTGVLGFSSNGGGASASLGFLLGPADPLGASAGAGIPRFNAAALHYANWWNGNEEHLTANYQFGNLWTHPITTTNTLQSLADTLFSQRQASQSTNTQDQHSLRGQYTWAPNQRTAIQLNFHGQFFHYNNQYSAATSSEFNKVLTNNGFRSINDQTTRHNAGLSASWRTQLGKQSGRVFSVTAGFVNNGYSTNGYLYSLNRFFLPAGNPESGDTVDQRKQLADRKLTYNTGLTYIQPIYPEANLGFSYDYSVISDAPLQYTYGQSGGKYDKLIDSLTDDLKTLTILHQAKINLQGKTPHLTYTVGLNGLVYNYRQSPIVKDSIFRLQYSTWLPQVLATFTPKSTISVEFNYLPLIQQPLATQLVPIRNNNDPLHLTIGNPELKPVTTQFFSLGFRWLKAWMIGTSANFGFSNSSISTRTTTDSLGRQISQPVNLGGKLLGGANFSVNRTLAGIDWGLFLFGTFERAENYVNATINHTNNFISNGGISATKYVTGKFSIQVNTRFGYSYATNSVNVSAPVHYWTQSHSGSASVYLLPHYEFGSSATYAWQQATNGLAGSTSVLLLNAYASRNLWQNKLVVKVVINNILDQNSGISRSIGANTNTQTATNILGRYGMLSVIYHFDKKFNKR